VVGVSRRGSAIRRGVIAVVVAALGLLSTGCVHQKYPQNALHPEGPYADKIDRLWRIVIVPAGIIFVLVMGLCLFVAIRYRARSDDDAPVQTHGNIKLELTWTIIPFVLLLVMGVLTVKTVFDINKIPKGSDVIPVTVTGHQWWWEYRYPTLGFTTANELHIPTGKKIAVTLTSADVIHSFWPTELAGKVDAIPGRLNHLTLEAVKPGKYLGQCAEYCGLSHANMRLQVIAHAPGAFDTWAANQRKPAVIPTDGQAATGASLFRSKGCAGCHSVTGYTAGQVGPNLTHLYSRQVFAGAIFPLDEPHLVRWLRNPPAEKPMMPQNGIGMPNLKLSDDDITNLIAFLQTLH
jgi:cytochrome c oxidase subunit 2